MYNKKRALYSQRVLWKGSLRPATVFIDGAKIAAVQMNRTEENGYEIEDYGNLVIMPGLIDAHVHLNEPGRSDWEGFETGTKAAAAGGITTLVDMPLNSTPVTTIPAALQEKRSAAKGKLQVNCGFWGGIVPDNIKDLEALLDAGVLGIKAFLTPSGIDDFPNVTEADLRKALPILKKKNAVLLVHCELDKAHEESHLLAENPRSYSAYLKSRPKDWENKAIELMIALCEEFETPVHLVHLSSSEAIIKIGNAKARKLPLTVETCPQYLYFQAEDIPDGATAFKCAPPIRESKNNEQLWKALQSDTIDFVVTDHSPAPPNLKELDSGDFQKAWGGIAGLQFSLPVMWTKARMHGGSVLQISDWMSKKVATFLKMDHRKGKIAKGYDADLVVWNPEASFKVATADIFHRHKVTPYLGEELFGKVETTFVNGIKVFHQGKFEHLDAGQVILSQDR